MAMTPSIFCFSSGNISSFPANINFSVVGKPENGGVELFADAEKRRFFSVFLKVLLDNRSGPDILAQIRKNAESFVASIAKLYKQGRAADET